MLSILTLQQFMMVPIFKKRTEEQTGKVQVAQPLFSPWENHGLTPLGTHFQAHEGHSDDYE